MKRLVWICVSMLGAISFGILALCRGEPVNAMWMVSAALCTYAIAYRFYARFIATKVLQLNPHRLTPAHRHADGIDYVATPKIVLFGHHFAAIALAGPLIGPVLAAQMGYLPGILWILAGVVLGGAVQDMTVLFLSTRRDGRSLGEMIRNEMGVFAGTVASVGILMIMIILLAVLALVVVKALAHSPWATFTVYATIPIAILMGLLMRFVRVGRLLEISTLGIFLLLTALWYGATVAASPALARWFDFSPEAIAIMIMGYGFLASVTPIWLLLAPRDYLSTFVKIGAIAALAIGILILRPVLQMPATTEFIHGHGPVLAGGLFPFLFITIACGSVSGFHALIASGTTPKMLENEDQIPFIGYGGMLTESSVAVMALVAASILQPGLYFAMNSPAALIGHDAVHAAQVISSWGFSITPAQLNQAAREIGETTLLSRAGGAPTLAVGMAQIFARALGSPALMGFCYHFAILFEALFILTAVDAGTRVARFMVQDFLNLWHPFFKNSQHLANNLLGSCLTVAAWGLILWQGVKDPLGGINSLWPLFGISNQMLASIALIFVTVVLLKMKRQRYAWISGVPALWLLVCTLTAVAEKLASSDTAIGFISHAQKFTQAQNRAELLSPAESTAQMTQIIHNDIVNSVLASGFSLILIAMVISGIVQGKKALQNVKASAHEAT